jgi:hypothetical protein
LGVVVLPLLVFELEEVVIGLGVDGLGVGAEVLLVGVEVVGSHEALVLVFVGLSLADEDVLADGGGVLLLEELVLGDEVVEAAILGRPLVLLLPQVEVVAQTLPQELVGVLLERHCLLLALITNSPEDALLVVPGPLQERVVDLDVLEHRLEYCQ